MADQGAWEGFHGKASLWCGLQSPSLPQGLMEEQHPREGPNSANRLHRSGLLWPRWSRSLKLTLGVLQAVPEEELDLHHIQHALRSSQLEHAVLENGTR